MLVLILTEETTHFLWLFSLYIRMKRVHNVTEMSPEHFEQRRKRGYARYNKETGVHALAYTRESVTIRHVIDQNVPGDIIGLETRITRLASLHPTPQRQAELRILRQRLVVMKKVRSEIR